jgi:hypothetical protein
MKGISESFMRRILAIVVSCEDARHTVPSPLVGEGQGEGWLRSKEPEAGPLQRINNSDSLHLFGLIYPTNAVRIVVPLSLSLPHKGGGNAVGQLCPNAGRLSRGRQEERVETAG